MILYIMSDNYFIVKTFLDKGFVSRDFFKKRIPRFSKKLYELKSYWCKIHLRKSDWMMVLSHLPLNIKLDHKNKILRTWWWTKYRNAKKESLIVITKKSLIKRIYDFITNIF